MQQFDHDEYQRIQDERETQRRKETYLEKQAREIEAKVAKRE